MSFVAVSALQRLSLGSIGDTAIITPLASTPVKGGVIRVIDSATGGIQKSTAGFIENENLLICFVPSTGGTKYGEFLAGYAGEER